MKEIICFLLVFFLGINNIFSMSLSKISALIEQKIEDTMDQEEKESQPQALIVEQNGGEIIEDDNIMQGGFGGQMGGPGTMTALFIASFTGQWMSTGDHIPALTGLLSTLVCLVLFGPDRFLIPAMLLITLVLTLLRSRREEA